MSGIGSLGYFNPSVILLLFITKEITIYYYVGLGFYTLIIKNLKIF